MAGSNSEDGAAEILEEMRTKGLDLKVLAMFQNW